MRTDWLARCHILLTVLQTLRACICGSSTCDALQRMWSANGTVRRKCYVEVTKPSALCRLRNRRTPLSINLPHAIRYEASRRGRSHGGSYSVNERLDNRPAIGAEGYDRDLPAIKSLFVLNRLIGGG